MEASAPEEGPVNITAEKDLIETKVEAPTDDANTTAKKKRKQSSNFSNEIQQEVQTLSLQVMSK